IRVLVVDDHPLMGQMTKQILEETERIKVIGVVGTGVACQEVVESEQPDIVFLDFQLPDIFGDVVAKWIKDRYPQIHIIIFTGIDIRDLYNYFIDLKVSGIISKESNGDIIVGIVDCVLKGHTVMPLSTFHQLKLEKPEKPRKPVLTEEEQHLMEMV